MTTDQIMHGLMALGFITVGVSILVAWLFFCIWLADIVGDALSLVLVFLPLAVAIFLVGAYGQ